MQLDMFGAPPPPPRRRPTLPEGQDRLLFALRPAPEAIPSIVQANGALRARHGLRGRPRPESILHVTLRHVADTIGPPPEVTGRLVAAAAQLRSAPFDVVLDHAARFAGSRAFVLLADPERNAALISFQKALCEVLDGAGAAWRVGGAAFTPHLTLSYEDRDVAEPVDPIVWTASEFVLIHSLIGQTRHETVARFALG